MNVRCFVSSCIGLRRVGVVLLFSTLRCLSHAGAIRYVCANSPSPAAPYTDWDHAAHTIQEAIASAADGDTVRVTNGVYDTGETVTQGALPNRVAVTNRVTVCSVNGPVVTVIRGKGPMGEGAVRCAYLVDGAVLSGFTLAGGATRTSGGAYTEQSGGGVFCDHGGAVEHCDVLDGAASLNGGGVFCFRGGVVRNCILRRNRAGYGGGVSCFYGGTVQNCSISRNSVFGGGGVSCDHGGTIQNCVLFFNTGFFGDDNYTNFGVEWDYAHCCMTPEVGTACVTNDPLFADRIAQDLRLTYGSPCIDAGLDVSAQGITNAFDGAARPTDGNFDGEARFDIGCYEYNPQTMDSDGDGMNDASEAIAGTGPTNRLDVFAVKECMVPSSNGECVVYWETVPGRLYDVLSQTNLSGEWSSVSQTVGDGTRQSYTHRSGGAGQHYFRLTVTTNAP